MADSQRYPNRTPKVTFLKVNLTQSYCFIQATSSCFFTHYHIINIKSFLAASTSIFPFPEQCLSQFLCSCMYINLSSYHFLTIWFYILHL